MTTKQENKQLKRPDSFQATAYRAIFWIRNNTRTVAQIVAPILISGVIYVGWVLFNNYSTENRIDELGKIDIALTAAIHKKAKEKESVEQALEDLRKKVETATAEDKTKLSAELAQKENSADAMKIDQEPFVQQYKSFYEKHKQKAEGWRAAVSAAQLLIEDKKLQDAANILGDMLSHSSNKLYFYSTTVRFLYINLLEELERYDDAIKETEGLLKMTTDDSKPKALLTLGRLYMDKKDYAQAKATFEKVVNEHNASQEAQRARALQTLIP